MNKFHKLLITTTAIVSVFGWNIHLTQAQNIPELIAVYQVTTNPEKDETILITQSPAIYIGSWYNVGLSNEYISRYRVFQKDGQVHDYQKLKTGLIGSSYKWDYRVLSNGSIRVFSLLKETCVLTKVNEMQCYSDGGSLGDLGLYIKR
jgi:hypothetical protein